VSVEVVNNKLKKLDGYQSTDEYEITGDVALTLGDFSADGNLEILLAADISTGKTGPGKILLELFEFKADGQGGGRLELNSRLTMKTAGPPTSLDVEAADYAGVGSDQLMLGYYPRSSDDGEIRMHLFRVGSDLQLNPPITTEKVGDPVQGTYFEMEPGLFHLDPSQNFDLRRSQLAVSYTTGGPKVVARIVEAASNLKKLTVQPDKVLVDSSVDIATHRIGPGMAVGNFIGFNAKKISPRDQLAVTVPVKVDGSPNTTMPRIVVSTVNFSKKKLYIKPNWYHNLTGYKVHGIYYAHAVVGYDHAGEYYYLGNPVHIEVPDVIDPEYVVAMPPKHVDYLPSSPDDPSSEKDIVNVSGYKEFFVELQDKQENTLKQTSKDTVSSTFGAGTTQKVSGTITAGDMDVAGAQASVTVKQAMEYETTSVRKRENYVYKSRTIEETARTNFDDVLVWNMRTIDMWRYPVYGVDLKRSKEYPFYELVIPGPLRQHIGGGRSIEWYNPRHSNNNVLSYARIGAKDFPEDLGQFTYGPDNETVKTTLNNPRNRTFDGNKQTLDMQWTEKAGGSEEKSYEYNLSASTDITVGFKAKGTIKKIGGTAEYEGTVSLNTKNSWSQSTVSEREISNARGIKLEQPAVRTGEHKGYQYESAIYVTQSGGLKVAHAVDPLGSQSGRNWWQDYYGRNPDPAVNLPNRFKATGHLDFKPKWKLTEGDQYHWMRGLAVTRHKPDPLTGQYHYLSSGVDDGEKVRIEARLYNFSVSAEAKSVEVSFAYRELDPNTFEPVGQPVEIGRPVPVDIAPMDIVTTAIVWDTSGLGGQDSGAGKPYRIEVTVDPDNTITGETHELGEKGGNNKGYWPWGTGFWVFNDGGNTRALASAGGAAADAGPPLKLNLSLTHAADAGGAAPPRHLRGQVRVPRQLEDPPPVPGAGHDPHRPFRRRRRVKLLHGIPLLPGVGGQRQR
jgi:hypothetical protein